MIIAITNNDCTAVSDPPVVLTQTEFTATIEVLLLSASVADQPNSLSTYKPNF